MLPENLLNIIRNNKTSLGEHPSFPPDGEDKFIVTLLTKYYDDLSGRVDVLDVRHLKNELSKCISKCKKIEIKNIQTLQSLCENIVTEFFDIPNETLRIEAKIVNHIDTKAQRMIPEKMEDYSFDDIDDINYLTNEIYKRRMLNCLIIGAATVYMKEMVLNHLKDLFQIDPDLPSLYKKIFDYNDLLLFHEKDNFEQNKVTDAGKVDVFISSSDSYPIIKSEGLLFPILLEETIRGILELAIANGLPKNREKAMYVIKKSDFKLAELWDMRIGIPLWNLIDKHIKENTDDVRSFGLNFFFMELANLENNTFNTLLKETFANTKAGRIAIKYIIDQIQYKRDEDDFNDFIMSKNQTNVLNDDEECFSPDELINDEGDGDELITDCEHRLKSEEKW